MARRTLLLGLLAVGAAWGVPRLIRDIRTEPGANVVSPGVEAVAIGPVAYFPGLTGANGWELWRTDGTPSGTSQVVDLRPGIRGSMPEQLIAVGSLLYFLCDDGQHGQELCVSDGTAAGTHAIDVNPGPAGSFASRLTVFKGQLYFVGTRGTEGYELLKHDGVSASADLVLDINPGTASTFVRSLTVGGDTLYFSADALGTGNELWKSDGTAAGTQLVYDLTPGGNGSFPQQLVGASNGVYFETWNGLAQLSTLWKSDGSSAPPIALLTWPSFDRLTTQVNFPRAFGDLLLFSFADAAHGRELWRSDGTAAGTGMLKDLAPGAVGSFPSGVTTIGGRGWFVANVGGNGGYDLEPWVTDGTAAGTMKLDFAPGTAGSGPYWIRPHGTEALLLLAPVYTQPELWVSDGTLAGSRQLIAFPTNTHVQVSVSLGADIMALVTGTNDGPTVWSWSAAADAGAPRASPERRAGSSPQDLVAWRGKLLFTAETVDAGRELWISDGTTNGTQMLQDINPGPGSSNPNGLTPMGPMVLFTALNASGYELWKTDGTQAGTAMVKDIYPGTYSGQPEHFAVLDGVAYFAATTATAGRELWRSDGTAAGTAQVADLEPGSTESYPTALTVAHGKLYFDTSVQGKTPEAWQSDGTAAGTRRLKDLAPGFPAGAGRLYVEAGDRVLTSPPSGVVAFNPADAGVEQVLSPGRLTPPGWWPGKHVPVGRVGTAAIFAAADSAGEGLYRTDGTTAGTTRVASLVSADAGRAEAWLSIDGQVYFIHGDPRPGAPAPFDWWVWKTDGTAAGTRRLASMVQSTDVMDPYGLPLFLEGTDAGLYFSRFTAGGGAELWTSDLEGQGLGLISDLAPGPRSSATSEALISASTLYFVGDDGVAGRELFGLDVPSSDTTPPNIEAVVQGPGQGGWYNGDVSVRWQVWDDESPVGTTSGCGDVTLVQSGATLTLQCTATSLGGTAGKSVTVRIDREPPVVVCPAPLVVASPDGQPVAVPYVVLWADWLSGVAQVTLDPPSGSALAPGVHLVTATATDVAGNRAQCTFEVTVDSLVADAGAPPPADGGAANAVGLLPGQYPAACGCQQFPGSAAALALLCLAMARRRRVIGRAAGTNSART